MKTEELALLKDDVISMGRKVEKTVEEMTRLLRGDSTAELTLIEKQEKEINAWCQDIEEKCMDLILDIHSKSSMDARTVRNLVSTIMIAAKLERMADHAYRVARIATWAREEGVEVPEEMIEMAGVIHRMGQDTLLSFLTDSPDKAVEILQRDNSVDYLHDVLSKRLLSDLGDQDKVKAQMRAQFLFCTRFLERMGDACCSIAKRIYFIATGKRLKSSSNAMKGSNS